MNRQECKHGHGFKKNGKTLQNSRTCWCSSSSGRSAVVVDVVLVVAIAVVLVVVVENTKQK
jgi:hypothetical protein